MKIFHSLRKTAAGRSGVLAAIAALTLLAAPIFLTACRGQQSEQTPGPKVFDGQPLYQKAFEALRDNHYTLVDPKVRSAFTAEWQHKHDHDHVLSSEKGTDNAIYEMMWSLGQRFDFYLLPAANDAERERKLATLSGVGMTIAIKDVARPLAKNSAHDATKGFSPPEPKAADDSAPLLSEDRALIVIEDPDDDTPTGQAHITRGDRILAVDGQSVNGLTKDQVVSRVKGTAGTKVTLTIAHKNISGVISTSTVTLTRARVVTHEVKVDYQGRIAHIRLRNFQSQYGAAEMAKAAAEAGQNADAIILDLRGNPGGSPIQAMDIAQMFMPEGVLYREVRRQGDHVVTVTYSLTHDKFVTTTQSDDGSPPQVQEQDRRQPLVPVNMPVIVLMNQSSASASELLSGALQASGRARVLGEPSTGKGVGQVIVPLPDDRCMHVTYFEFQPGGRKIDWVGIIPDIEVKLPVGVDLADGAAVDTQLKAANLELLRTIQGHPSPARPAAQIESQRLEMEKLHRENFQKDQLWRSAEIKKNSATTQDSKNSKDGLDKNPARK